MSNRVRSSHVLPAFGTGVALALLAGCAEPPKKTAPMPALGVAHFENPAEEKPRIRWGDDPLSLNDRCIVRKVKLNLRMPPIFVNGKPIGFC